MTSLKVLAEALGLSVTQVSRALDDKPDVAAKTKERVRAEALKRGYTPNAAARSMRKQRTETVAVVLPSGSNAIGLGALVETLYDTARGLAAYGYDLIMIPARDAADELNALMRVVDGRRADAVIVVRTKRDDPRVRFLASRGIPFACHGRTGQTDHAYVDGDGETAFADATHLLASLGHQRIAHISGPQEFNFAYLRRKGWASAMQGLGFEGAMLEVSAEPTERGGYDAACNLLARRDRPTALLCATDAMAIGAYAAAQEYGLEPGRTISIVGHDDLPAGMLLTPKLSTMRIASTALGEQLASHLHARLDGADADGLQTVFPVIQVPRASHGALIKP